MGSIELSAQSIIMRRMSREMAATTGVEAIFHISYEISNMKYDRQFQREIVAYLLSGQSSEVSWPRRSGTSARVVRVAVFQQTPRPRRATIRCGLRLSSSKAGRRARRADVGSRTAL